MYSTHPKYLYNRYNFIASGDGTYIGGGPGDQYLEILIASAHHKNAVLDGKGS